jgi:tetratricopeptide (TPR) repeat protein
MPLLAPLVAVLLSLASPAIPFSTAEARGDAAWERRAEGFQTHGRANAVHARAALEAYEEAHRERPDDLRVQRKLIEALYFEAYFLAEVERRPAAFERLVELSEDLLERAPEAGATGGPDRRDGHFWSAISWGLWGMSHSKLASARQGVAGKIRDHAQALIDLDPSFADAGGLRLLGRLHTATPKVPFVTGWIDRSLGIDLLERACAITTADARNPLFLAEALHRHRRRERGRALELLRDVASRAPTPAREVEDSEHIAAARERLAQWAPTTRDERP